MCAVPTLVTTPQSGAAMRARAAISPAWFMPISTTAISCSGSRRSSCKRQAEAVVQIAVRLEHVEFCAERGGDGFLGGGFAGRAGDGHDAPAPLAAHMRGQGLQSDKRIFGDEQRRGQHCIGQCGHARARDDGGDCAALEGSLRQSRGRRGARRARRKTVRRGRRCASRWSSRGPSSAPALATLAGASSTAPAPMAASARVSFIALHHSRNWHRAVGKGNLRHRRRESCGRRGSAPSRGPCRQ